jgi:hypothetical protein
LNRIVAIHQPNFFPWLGYFDKIARCEAFVILDDVQFPKKGGAWSNRVKLLIGGEARWMTAAIDRNYSSTRTIREMHFLTNNPWRMKMLKSFDASYRRHPFYAETMAIIEPLILNTESNIAEYNIQTVSRIAQELGLDIIKMQRSSELPAEGSSNELLCSLTQLTGGDTYMCGGGADGYHDDAVFASAGIELKRQDFQHPEYPQHNAPAFQAGLSIIDAVANIGWGRTSELLGSSE